MDRAILVVGAIISPLYPCFGKVDWHSAYQPFLYSDIFNLIRYWTGMELPDIRNWEVDEDTLYMTRTELLKKEWQKIPLTESEKEFWKNKENQITNAPICGNTSEVTQCLNLLAEGNLLPKMRA